MNAQELVVMLKEKRQLEIELDAARDRIEELEVELGLLEYELPERRLSETVIFGDVYIVERCGRCDGKGERQHSSCEQCFGSGVSLKPLTLAAVPASNGAHEEATA